MLFCAFDKTHKVEIVATGEQVRSDRSFAKSAIAFRDGLLFNRLNFDQGGSDLVWLHQDGTLETIETSIAFAFEYIGSPPPFSVIGDSIYWLELDKAANRVILRQSDGSPNSATSTELPINSFYQLSGVYRDPSGRIFFGVRDGIDANTVWGVVSKPTADAGADAQVPEGSPYYLDARASLDLENAIVSYEWDLDYDGSVFDVDASGVTVPFDTSNGPFSRTTALRVTDLWGNTSIATKDVFVENVAPTITGLGDASAVLGEAVSLSADIADPGLDDSISLAWNLGDGTIIQDQTSVSHTYENEGEFFATLTASDGEGPPTVREFRRCHRATGQRHRKYQRDQRGRKCGSDCNASGTIIGGGGRSNFLHRDRERGTRLWLNREWRPESSLY